MSYQYMHSFHLSDEHQYEGVNTVEYQDGLLKRFKLGDVRGKTVLDTGCSNGYYSIQLARQGAIVTATDIHPPSIEEVNRWALLYDVEIETHILNVYDVPDLKRNFDIVLFMGLIYHLRHPLLALDKLAMCTNETIIIETHTTVSKETVMEFYDADQINNDPSNWWGPTPSCMHQMAKTSGFKKTETLMYHRDWRRLMIKGIK